jgi:hypothetical protein
VASISQRSEELRLQPGLEYGNLKPRLKGGIFNCIYWLKDSSLGGDDWDFLKEGFKTYPIAPMSPLNSPTFFLF